MTDRPQPADDPLEDLHVAFAPPGKPGVKPQRWALAGALALLALGAALLIWRSLAPLPAPASAEQASAVPPLIAATPEALSPPAAFSVEDRRALLADLARAGNIFAPDRAPWPEPTDVAQERSQDAQRVTLGAAPDAEPPAVRRPDGRLDIDGITLTPVSNQLPPALFREASAMKLEVVWGAVAPSAAQPDLGAAIRRGEARGVYREGDEIPGEGQPWRLLAIDLDNERVIVSKQGHNVELRLRNRTAPVVAAAPEAAEAGRASPGGGARTPSVSRASPESVRAQLRDAGLEAWEIEAILRLAQRPEADAAPSGADEAAQASNENAGASGGSQGAKPAAKPPVVPAEIAALLRMMTSGQAPTIEPPKQQDEDESDDDPDGGV